MFYIDFYNCRLMMQPVQKILEHIIEYTQAKSILWVESSSSLIKEMHFDVDINYCEILPTEVLLESKIDKPYELTLLLDCLDILDKQSGQVLIGKLRDCYSKHLIVLQSNIRQHSTSDWCLNDFLALGLALLPLQLKQNNQKLPFDLYQFNLHDYKIVPDWLNSKYWAHPELFDKYYW